MLAPLTCGVVLLISGVAKVGDPTATRDAFMSMGVPQALRSETLVTPLPYVEIALGVLLLVTWSLAPGGRRGRDDGAVRGVLGARAPRAAARRGGRLRVLRSPGRRPGLGHDAGAQLLPGGARRPRHGLRSRRFGCAARRCATSGPTDWWWLAAHGRGGGHGRARGGAAPPRGRRSPTTTCSTTSASPSPSPCWRTSPGPAPRCGSWPAERPQLLVFLSSTAGRARRSPRSCPTGSRISARSRSRRCSPSPSRASRTRCGPSGSPAWFDVEHGATDDLRRRTTVRRPAGGRRGPGRRARRRCGRRRHVRRGHRGRADAPAPGPADAGRARARLHRRPATGTTTGTTTAHEHTRDDGHGHA